MSFKSVPAVKSNILIKSQSNIISKIYIKDKIKNGINEIFPYYLPIINIFQIYNLFMRIGLCVNRVPKEDLDIYKKYFSSNNYIDVCYEII